MIIATAKYRCQHCKKEFDTDSELEWVTDRYNIPFKKVCSECREDVEDQIGGYVFDSSDAGECLEPEDY